MRFAFNACVILYDVVVYGGGYYDQSFLLTNVGSLNFVSSLLEASHFSQSNNISTSHYPINLKRLLNSVQSSDKSCQLFFQILLP